MLDFDILVVGCGPAGIAAACTAAELGQRTAIVDMNPSSGGQIWRKQGSEGADPQAAHWSQRLERAGLSLMSSAQVVDRYGDACLVVDIAGSVESIRYGKLILATGARERWIPFPGWTLPNVMGAGGLQALVREGMPIAAKRVVVAGSGPLLLAVAAHLVEAGARVPIIAEQASFDQLCRFGLALTRQPGKLTQAIRLRWALRRTRHLNECVVAEAQGDSALEQVTLQQQGRTWTERCDYLACGFGLVPNTELASLLGCGLKNGNVVVDAAQQTTVPDIYCAGEPTGIGGVDLALIEGEIAGCAAAGAHDRARALFATRERAQQFAAALNDAFALRDELRSLTRPDTIVCRCEDVRFERLESHQGWRSAKLHTRCGMGPCQGRVCGPAVEFLKGWQHESIRPPLFPTTVAALCRRSGDPE